MNEKNLESIRESEMAVIGSILIDEKILSQVIDKLTWDDFYFDDLKFAYKSILKLSNEGKAVDYVTVLNECRTFDLEFGSSMKSILFECANLVPSVQNADYYAGIVHRNAISRKVKNCLLDSLSNEFSSEDVIEKTESLINNLSKYISPIQSKKMKSFSEISLNLLNFYLGKASCTQNRCDTGYPKIDEILKGMSGGNLIVLASRPKVGKTAFALSIAENVAKTGKKVVFYSQEMLGEELCERILSTKSDISMDKLINNSFTPLELKTLENTILSTKSGGIIINDSTGITSQSIRLGCRMIKNLGLIIVDYLQLMKSSNSKHENRNQEIGSISRELKCLVTDLNVPILCLSQLNRNSNENQRPSPAELRDSGSIEQEANKVILMWCVKNHGNSKTIGVDVALNRRGKTGVTLLNFNGNKMQFTEIEKRYKETNFEDECWREN